MLKIKVAIYILSMLIFSSCKSDYYLFKNGFTVDKIHFKNDSILIQKTRNIKYLNSYMKRKERDSFKYTIENDSLKFDRYSFCISDKKDTLIRSNGNSFRKVSPIIYCLTFLSKKQLAW